MTSTTETGAGGLDVPARRYLLVRSKGAMMRVALPTFGSVSVGSSRTNELMLDLPGISEEHIVLHIDFGIGLEVLDSDTAVRYLSGKKTKERPLKEGQTIELEPNDSLRIGSAELDFVVPLPETTGNRIWTRSYLRKQLRAAYQADRPSVVVILLRIVGLSEGEAAAALIEVSTNPEYLIADFSKARFVMLATNTSQLAAQTYGLSVAKALEERGATVDIGSAIAKDGDASAILKVASQRMTRATTAGIKTDRLIARDPAMNHVAKVIDQLARSSSHVLILGETGVGKDLVAHTIHEHSDRAERPLVRISCVDLPDSFLEENGLSENGAQNLMQRALGGTVLLDEVGGLSSRAQISLGRLLEESDNRPPGEDVRFIVTTNQNLLEDVKKGSFRKDLFYRLNRVCIDIPPLRKRTADIIPLAETFLAQACTEQDREGTLSLSEDAVERLLAYRWPGNVRELKNAIERAIMASTGDMLDGDLFPEAGSESSATPAPTTEKKADKGEPRASLREEMAALEKRRILEALERYPTQSEAAKALDIPLRTFLNRLDALGIPRARKK